MVTTQAAFDVADDMLREAWHERLAGHGPISILRSGRIGPIVELALASLQHVVQYETVTIDGEFASNLSQALLSRQPFGSSFQDVAGVFPLSADNPITSNSAIWDQWTVHAENIAKAKGLSPHVVASLMGAMVEIQDNVYEHSGAPHTGLVAYAVTEKSFEFVVADSGIGVLRTLRQNPEYNRISDSGAALEEIIKDGVSRFPSETGRGQGFNQLFRSLVGHNAELRFRSGDHALTMRPTSDVLHGKSILSQVASLHGLAVTVFYRFSDD